MRSFKQSITTAKRVLQQLKHDPRTVALLLLIPLVLMAILRYVFGTNSQLFAKVGPLLIAVFPFTLMFVVTSISMLRERTSGTLERLLTTPASKIGLLLGYGMAFGGLALLQVALTIGLCVSVLGLSVTGNLDLLAFVAVLDALLGMSFGLLISAFANSEFQAVQFMPAFVFPQLLVSGIFYPRPEMSALLQFLSDIFPMTYVVDGASRASTGQYGGSTMFIDVLVVVVIIPASLCLGALTLRRQTN